MSRYRAMSDPKGYIIFGTGLILIGALVIVGYFWILFSRPPDFDVVTATIAVLALGGFVIILGIVLIVKREYFLEKRREKGYL